MTQVKLSADTVDARYDGDHALKDGLKLGWALEYAAQQDAGDNAADVDAHYQLVELKLLFPAAGITPGRELLSRERGTSDATANLAFHTPPRHAASVPGLGRQVHHDAVGRHRGRLPRCQPEAGRLEGTGRVARFSAEATDADYGTEFDLVVSRRFADRYEFVL